MIKLVLIDYDGVLVDSFPTVFNVYKKICAEFGVPAPKTIDGFRAIYGHNYVECCTNLGIPAAGIPRVEAIYAREIMNERPPLFPGVSAMLTALQPGRTLCVVSNTTVAEIEQKLVRYNIRHFFSGVYAKESPLPTSKVVMMTAIMQQYGVTLDQTVFVGDRTLDYQAGIGVGLDPRHIIMADYGWGYDRLIIRPEVTAQTPLQVVDRIQQLDTEL